MNHTRYILRHRRGSIFVSRFGSSELTFPMETLAVVEAASTAEATGRAQVVREAIAAAGRGYVPGPEIELSRVA